MKYQVCESLLEKDNKHCAALIITRNFEYERGRLVFASPSSDLRNGTITFVSSNGHVYGVTCLHVIEHYRKQIKESGNPLSHSMRTMVNGFYEIIDRFINPSPDFVQGSLDIAIRELSSELLNKIGKSAIDLNTEETMPENIKFGYAVGFPEKRKYHVYEDKFRHRLSMPHYAVLAEIDSTPDQRFSLFSDLEDDVEDNDFSGMSGGPIYWSTKDNYGIMGINYNTLTGSELIGTKAIQISGELATPSIIKKWILDYHDKNK